MIRDGDKPAGVMGNTNTYRLTKHTDFDFNPVSFANPISSIQREKPFQPIYSEKRSSQGKEGGPSPRAPGEREGKKARQMRRNNEGTKVLHAKELRSRPRSAQERKKGGMSGSVIVGGHAVSSRPFHDFSFLALASFGEFFVFVPAMGAGWVVVLLVLGAGWSVNVFFFLLVRWSDFRLPVIHGPVPILLSEMSAGRVRDSCATISLARSLQKKGGGHQSTQAEEPPHHTSASGSSVVAALHDYTAPAALLWCVGILALGHGTPDGGHHVVPGAVAVGDDAAGMGSVFLSLAMIRGQIAKPTSWTPGSRGCVPGQGPHVAAS